MSCSARAQVRVGYAFYIKDGKLRYVHNYVGRELPSVESDDAVPTGKHELRFEFEPTGQPDLAQRQGCTRHGSSSTSTATWSATPMPPSRRPSCSTPAR